MPSLKDYNYHLPSELIAQRPLTRRDEARMLVINRRDQSIIHSTFKHLPDYLPQNCLIVRNNSKVIPARFLGHRKGTGGKIEVFLLKQAEDSSTFEVLIKPLKRLKNGDVITFKGGLETTVIDREKRIVRFNRKNILSLAEQLGVIPLPPYIERPSDAHDRKYYQTVYAKHHGSVASPTAGLHFTNRMIQSMEKRGHIFADVTLHINYGTFKPVEAEDITEHHMHAESYTVKPSVYKRVLRAREQGKSVVAVGTTSCRVLETLAKTQKTTGETNLFIYEGYSFKLVDILITNFHLPMSTLLMLVYAFGGKALMQKAYQEAIDHQYRFYSYGDGMVIV
ncbi:MAG: tRNA preQ1(34) S-adenosylmethionine ribosyltransferase-isomerase QueA [Candidatus Omnitrophica bacterium]|nr:tRNA preQ1(34) S-adenosylmethionine ribosyltransferase-isomerase QueA [Candidatus Omnitrophota bacterium]